MHCSRPYMLQFIRMCLWESFGMCYENKLTNSASLHEAQAAIIGLLL